MYLSRYIPLSLVTYMNEKTLSIVYQYFVCEINVFLFVTSKKNIIRGRNITSIVYILGVDIPLCHGNRQVSWFGP